MATREMTYQDWKEALDASHGSRQFYEYIGPSPGGAAADFGISRQRIYQLVGDGKLDMIKIWHGPDADHFSQIVTDASIARLKSTRAMDQPPLPLGKPKGKVRSRLNTSRHKTGRLQKG